MNSPRARRLLVRAAASVTAGIAAVILLLRGSTLDTATTTLRKTLATTTTSTTTRTISTRSPYYFWTDNRSSGGGTTSSSSGSGGDVEEGSGDANHDARSRDVSSLHRKSGKRGGGGGGCSLPYAEVTRVWKRSWEQSRDADWSGPGSRSGSAASVAAAIVALLPSPARENPAVSADTTVVGGGGSGGDGRSGRGGGVVGIAGDELRAALPGGDRGGVEAAADEGSSSSSSGGGSSSVSLGDDGDFLSRRPREEEEEEEDEKSDYYLVRDDGFVIDHNNSTSSSSSSSSGSGNSSTPFYNRRQRTTEQEDYGGRRRRSLSPDLESERTAPEANSTNTIAAADAVRDATTPTVVVTAVHEDNGNSSSTLSTAVVDRAQQCSALEVVGIDDCPELLLPQGAVLEEMLVAKRDMLRQIVDVLGDPASWGDGGAAGKPLLLVKMLAVDEADAVYGAFEPNFMRWATDAAGWSPESGGFNRWVEKYHREVLRSSRPVIVSVHGDDVCALEKEIDPDKRMGAATGSFEGSAVSPPEQLAEPPPGRRTTPGYGRENFDVPLVLVTLGWDPYGDPTHTDNPPGRDVTCALRVLELSRVVRWFTSHTRGTSRVHAKFRYIPIGFGGYQTRNFLPQQEFVDAAKRQLDILETCPTDRSGRYDLLFQCSTLERDSRTEIWKSMTEKESGPFPVNRAPLGADEMVVAASKGIFAVSPPGTGPDCFRHYEMMLEGNIVMIPDEPSLRQIMDGLPVFFFGDSKDWGSLTCGRLLEMAKSVQAKIREGNEGKGGGLEFQKLTHGFWRRYIRRETLLAGGSTNNDQSSYVERSVAPLNLPGWSTFRELGCFLASSTSRFAKHHYTQGQTKKYLSKQNGRAVATTPESCAKMCSFKLGGGEGFFSISDGDQCWCDRQIEERVDPGLCNIPCGGRMKDGRKCGGDGVSTVYAFGPERRNMPFEYLGCFPDTFKVMFHERTLMKNSNTPSMCEAFCTSHRYPFFALARKEWCRCGVMPSNTSRSVREPAYIEGGSYEPPPGPPNATLAGKPVPAGVQVGDERFECSRRRCSGDASLSGCGSEKAYDLYRVVDPCMLYRDCAKD